MDGEHGTRSPGGDDPERRDDHLDQTFQGIAQALNAIVARESEDHDRRVRQESEQYDRRQSQATEMFNLRQSNREHQASLERQQLTEELGRRAGNGDVTFRDRLGHSVPAASIEEENVENVTDAPDTGTDQPKA